MDRLSGRELDELLHDFLSEDVGSGDITTETSLPPGIRARGTLMSRGTCIVSGLPVARRVFELLDPGLEWKGELPAGCRAEPATALVTLSGFARAILTAERVALNLLQRMCGIATATRSFVEAVAGTGCRILDTRKTAPGLRPFDRQAVRDGGGSNHRYGLSDMVLIKDNHRRLAGGVVEAVRRTRRGAPEGMTIEVEVETEEELRQALSSGADAILIDNQTPETVARWCGIARQTRKPPCLEASGNMNLRNVRAYAEAGVDAISVGALTHSVSAADISLEVEA